MTKPTYSELEQELADERLAFNHANEVVGKLESDLARVRGLLQRILKLRGMRLGAQMSWDEIAAVCAESADIGKLDRVEEKTWCDVPNCGRRPRLRAFYASSPELTEPYWPKETQRMIDSATQWSEEQGKEVCVCGDIRCHHAFGSGFSTRNPEKCSKFQKRGG